MSSTREQIPPRRKRPHTDNPSESQPFKRLKSSSAEFYDSLSKVWLTRRALKELDRRTRQANSPQRPASAPRRVYRESSKQIQRFARHGGVNLCDLRGYPAPADVDPTRAMASSSSSRGRNTRSTVPTSASSSTRRSYAYDKDFEQYYIDHRVYPKGYDYRDGTPEPGLEELYERLPQPRPSLSPSRFTNSDFRDFARKNDRVISEGKVMSTVFPIISGDTNIPNEGDLVFTRLESMTSSVTVDPKPDFYDGARLEDVDKEVREELGRYILPTGHATAPVAPNFFMDAKAPHGAADVAKRQAMQDGAYGARAMHSLQSYGKGIPFYDSNAYTITTTYHDGQLKIYSTHPTRGEDGISPEYHMTQVKAFALTSDPNTFRQGTTAFRNARDWAQEQRDKFIIAANEKARSTNTEPPRTKHMTYSDWLAALDTGDASAPTVEDGSDPPTFSAEDQVDDSQSSLSQPQVYAYEEQSIFESPNDDGSSNEPVPLASNDGHSDIHPTQESDSADELALDASFAIPTTEKKRKHKSKIQQSRIDAAKSRSNDSAGSSHQRRRPKRGKVDAPSSSVSDWVWDEQRKLNMAWDKGLERWVYWDEVNKAEKYLDDDKKWQWVEP